MSGTGLQHGRHRHKYLRSWNFDNVGSVFFHLGKVGAHLGNFPLHLPIRLFVSFGDCGQRKRLVQASPYSRSHFIGHQGKTLPYFMHFSSQTTKYSGSFWCPFSISWMHNVSVIFRSNFDEMDLKMDLKRTWKMDLKVKFKWTWNEPDIDLKWTWKGPKIDLK